jgi:hypothetical protein
LRKPPLFRDRAHVAKTGLTIDLFVSVRSHEKCTQTRDSARGIVGGMDTPTDVELVARLLVARLVVLCGRSEAVRILEQVIADVKAAEGSRPPHRGCTLIRSRYGIEPSKGGVG